jgi:hypothetical protein
MAGRTGEPHPSQDSVHAAITKATEGDWWRLASPQLDPSNYPRWCVPSRTTPGVYYTVWRRKAGPGDWWDILDCNCPAIESGRYVVCWHKACVFVRNQRFRGGPK